MSPAKRVWSWRAAMPRCLILSSRARSLLLELRNIKVLWPRCIPLAMLMLSYSTNSTRPARKQSTNSTPHFSKLAIIFCILIFNFFHWTGVVFYKLFNINVFATSPTTLPNLLFSFFYINAYSLFANVAICIGAFLHYGPDPSWLSNVRVPRILPLVFL